MGEVYRARDPRLGRDVAIKVLPASFSNDRDRLKRFEQEARAAGVLNHPNVTIVFDVGQHDGAPYVVQELLEGQTLRAELTGGRFSPRKAIDYAVQIAQGLAAAHDKGIIHRDLKPENVFVTREGRVKVLDFGLAKLTQVEGSGSSSQLPTATEPGVVMGTFGYMSPEQIKTVPVDARSDIFALGVILYEMLSGQRPFRGDSPGETMAAILKEDPPDLTATDKNINPGLERLVRHCLEKEREERFQSARDLAFDLSRAAAEVSSPRGSERAAMLGSTRWARRVMTAAVLVVVGAALGLLFGMLLPRSRLPSLARLTWERGTIRSARFSPDGQSVLYGAAWDGRPFRLFVTRPEAPQSSAALPVPDADILSLSKSGEMAVSLNRRYFSTFVSAGTLGVVALVGGTPREVLETVGAADYAPDGRLAIVRRVGETDQLEFPIGKVLYRTGGYLSHPRVSRNGDCIAFLDHPVFGDNRGFVRTVDLKGRVTTLTEDWPSLEGLAWSANGKEIWFTGAPAGNQVDWSLYAVNRSGRLRAVWRVPTAVSIMDISAAGRALVTRNVVHGEIFALPRGGSREVNLTWLGWSGARDLSRDGSKVLLTSYGLPQVSYAALVRPLDGGPAVSLASGEALALSPDGATALAIDVSSPPRVLVVPTGAGEPRPLPTEVKDVRAARFLPDGRRVLVVSQKTGEPARCFVQQLAGGPARLITPDGILWGGNEAGVDGRPLPTPDGTAILARRLDGRFALHAVDGGAPRFIPIGIDERPIAWAGDGGQALYVFKPRALPIRIERVDLVTGKRTLWRQLEPQDPAGLTHEADVLIAGDVYAYNVVRIISDLFVVDGLE